MRDGDRRRYHEAALNNNKNRSKFAACFWVKSQQPTTNQSILPHIVKRSAFSLVVCEKEDIDMHPEKHCSVSAFFHSFRVSLKVN